MKRHVGSSSCLTLCGSWESKHCKGKDTFKHYGTHGKGIYLLWLKVYDIYCYLLEMRTGYICSPWEGFVNCFCQLKREVCRVWQPKNQFFLQKCTSLSKMQFVKILRQFSGKIIPSFFSLACTWNKQTWMHFGNSLLRTMLPYLHLINNKNI